MLPFYENQELPFRCFLFHIPSYPPHLHREMEILYVRTGTVQLFLSGRTYFLKKGDAAVVFPNQIHSYETTPGSQLIMTIFDHSLMRGLYGNLMTYSSVKPVVPADRIHPELPESMEKLLHLSMEQISGGTRISHASVLGYHTLILGQILEEIPLTESNTSLPDSKIQMLLDYMAGHYLEPITILDISRAVGLSKYYISRIFNQKLRCPFNSYLNALRLNDACNQLLSTNDTLESISLRCGFENERSFYRNFQILFGMTPTQYRKQSLSKSWDTI